MTRRAALDRWLATLPTAWLRDVSPEAIAIARDAHETPGRHYHGWDHASACIELLRESDVEHARPVFLALVFHDAVYVPGAADNEARSAALASETLAAHARMPEAELDSIARMILATREHQALGERLSRDERAMLDLDLSILGAAPDVYARYAAAIEREYVPAVTTPAGFRIGRREFLGRLLARSRIYLTDAGEARWGEAARANVAREIASLRARQGWHERLVGWVGRLATGTSRR